MSVNVLSVSDVFDPTKTTEDYKELLKTKLLQIDPDMDNADGQGMMMILSIVAVALDIIIALTLADYNSKQIPTASLADLINNFCPIYGIQYKEGKKTLIPIVLTIDVSDKPVVLYNYTNAEHEAFKISSNIGNIYLPVADELVFNESGEYTIMFQSEEYGAYIDNVGAINNILTSTYGVISVVNNQQYTSLGEETESVESLRQRLRKAERLRNGTVNVKKKIEDSLINNGCDDALVYSNYLNTTMYEVPSGNCVIVCYNGDKDTIIETISQQVYGVCLYNFGIVPDSNAHDNYCQTIDLSNNLYNLLQVNNGLLSLDINGNINTFTLDLTQCVRLADIVDKMNEEMLGVCTASLIDNYIRFTTNNNESIKLVSSEITEGQQNLYSYAYLNGAMQLIVVSGYRNIGVVKYLDEGRYTSIITYNETVVSDIKIQITTNQPLNNNEKQLFQQYLIDNIYSLRVFRIHKAVANAEIASIGKTYFDSLQSSNFIQSIKFYYNDMWQDSIIPQHIYEIFNCPIDNIIII